MRKNNKRYLLTALAAILISSLMYGTVSALAQPGDTSDPLVTKRYVDEQINQLKALISGLSAVSPSTDTNTNANTSTNANVSSLSQDEKDAIVAEVLAFVEILYGESLRNPGAVGQTDPQAQAQQPETQQPETQPPVTQANTVTTPYEVVMGRKGQTLTAMSGTEIILRGGAAVAVTGINGLCDVTVGADIINGTSIPMNHLLIVPASDGRGMYFTTDAFLMVKGEYYLQD